MTSYVDRAARYAAAVIAGTQPVSKWTRLAIERQVNDLERAQNDPQWRYRWDVERAERPALFCECMPHIKGLWKSVTIELEDWQCWVITTVFGWVDRVSGARRFRTVYIEVPRKNAKSAITSGVALYCLSADGENGAEVYSAATTGDQARIVFDVAKQMVRRESRVAAQFGISTGEHAMYVEQSASSFRPLNAEGSTQDGLNVHFAAVDELHAHKRRDMWDVLATATGSRTQPLLWAITTAGSNRAGICYEQRDYVCKVLDGVTEDDTYFGVIYTIDDGDDWLDEAVWAKANPNLGVSVSIEDLRSKARFAAQQASAQGNFLTKHLNVWVSSDSAWMDMRAWDACADPTLKAEQFAGEECIVALDLASKIDIAARVRLFERDGIYYAFLAAYLPERAVETGRNSQYEGWARRGLLHVTPGEVTDYDVIEQDVLEDSRRYQLIEVPFDPFQATQMSGHLLDQGLPMVEMRPTVLNFSEPMKQLEALVLQGKFRHDGNPVLAWMASNVVCHRDAKDNIYPRREREENKIDGIVALIMALGRAMARRDDVMRDGALMVV